MRSIIAWVVLTIALTSNLFAQPDSLWSRTYGGSSGGVLFFYYTKQPMALYLGRRY